MCENNFYVRVMKHRFLYNNSALGWRTNDVPGQYPLVLLHGFCEDTSVWDLTVAQMTDIPVLRMDLPGFGTSDRLETSTVTAFAHALAAMLQEAGAAQVVLVGHSMGGYVALEFARLYPEHLLGLGLFHAHPFADTPERLEARRRGIHLLQQGKQAAYVGQLFPGLFKPEFAALNPDCLSSLIQNAQTFQADSIIAALELMMARPDQCDTVKNLNCPLLLFLGTDDLLVPMRETLEACLGTSRLSLTIARNVAHMGMFEAPLIANQAIVDFWKYCTQKVG